MTLLQKNVKLIHMRLTGKTEMPDDLLLLIADYETNLLAGKPISQATRGSEQDYDTRQIAALLYLFWSFQGGEK